MMGFTFGPYLVLMVALARRLFANGTSVERAAAQDGKPVTLRRIAGEGEVLDLNCSMPDLPSLPVWLFHPTTSAPRFYPPDVPLVPGHPLLVFSPDSGWPARFAIWFAPDRPADLVGRLAAESLAGDWLTSPGKPSPMEGGGTEAVALHQKDKVRFILDMPIAEEPAVLMIQAQLPTPGT